MAELDWDAVRFFLAAARERSLAGAAKKLDVNHTTVGRRLAELEDALGTKLFLRTPDGLTPTEAAQSLLPLAEDMERVARRLADARPNDVVAGIVRVSAPEAFTGFLVRRLLPRLRRQHPDLVVDVHQSDARADLAGGEADLALRMGPLMQPSLTCRKLETLGWSLYASPSYVGTHATPWSLPDACARDVIGYDEDLVHSPGARFLDANVAAARIVMRTSSIIAALAAASAGLGVAALPCFVGAGDAGVVRVVDDVIGERDAFLVLHPDRRDSARVRAVIDALVAVFTEDATTLRGR